MGAARSAVGSGTEAAATLGECGGRAGSARGCGSAACPRRTVLQGCSAFPAAARAVAAAEAALPWAEAGGRGAGLFSRRSAAVPRGEAPAVRGRRALSQTITRAPFPGEPPWRLAGQPGRQGRGAARRPVPRRRSGRAVGPRGRARGRPVPPLLAARCHPAGAAARFERIFGSFHTPRNGISSLLSRSFACFVLRLSMVVYF